MLSLCQFYLTLPELQDATSDAELQPSTGALAAGQCPSVQLLMSALFDARLNLHSISGLESEAHR